MHNAYTPVNTYLYAICIFILQNALDVDVYNMHINAMGKEIQNIRNALGLTQIAFGLKIGFHKMTVWRWEKDIASPKPITMDALRALVKDKVLTD